MPRRRPAIVDRQHQGPVAGQRRVGIEQGVGERQDDERDQHHAHEDEPQRRLGRRLLAWRQAQEQAQRREAHAPRRRRRHPQQPPQHRQHGEPQQEPRRGKGEGTEGEHQLPPTFAIAHPPPTLTLPLKGGGDERRFPPPPLRGRAGRGVSRKRTITSAAAAPARRRAPAAPYAAVGRCGAWRSSSRSRGRWRRARRDVAPAAARNPRAPSRRG